MEISSEINSWAVLSLPLAQVGQLSVMRKYVHIVLVSCL